MELDDLLQAIKYSKDNRVSIDELLCLLAEYIGDKDVIDTVDLYVSDYSKWFDKVDLLYQKCKDITKIMESEE